MIPTARDFSVKYGRDPSMGLEGQKAFPFIYTLVSHNDDTWKPVSGATQPSLACLGPTVPKATVITPVEIIPGHVEKYVSLDPDYNFKILAIKYSAYYWNSRDGEYIWNFPQEPLLNMGMDPDMRYPGSSLLQDISITMSYQGSGSSVIASGGQDTGALGGQRLPLPVENKQGYDYGYYTVRTPHLLPRQGMLVFDIYNRNYYYDLIVAAAVYGMKVRV